MKSAQSRPQILVMDSQLVGDGTPSAISVTNMQESESKPNSAAEIFHQTFGSGIQSRHSTKEKNKRPISTQSHISNFVTATKQYGKVHYQNESAPSEIEGHYRFGSKISQSNSKNEVQTFSAKKKYLSRNKILTNSTSNLASKSLLQSKSVVQIMNANAFNSGGPEVKMSEVGTLLKTLYNHTNSSKSNTTAYTSHRNNAMIPQRVRSAQSRNFDSSQVKNHLKTSQSTKENSKE